MRKRIIVFMLLLSIVFGVGQKDNIKAAATGSKTINDTYGKLKEVRLLVG